MSNTEKTAVELDETLQQTEEVLGQSLLSDETVEEYEQSIRDIVNLEKPCDSLRYEKHSIYKPSRFQEQVLVNRAPDKLFRNPLEAIDPDDALKKYGLKLSKDSSMFPNNKNLPAYGDFSEFRELGDRVNLYLQCKEQFDALPNEVRKEFDYDLDKFTKYVNSPDFDITRVMTKEYKEKVHNPRIKEIERQKAYAEYVKQQQEKEMLEK